MKESAKSCINYRKPKSKEGKPNEFKKKTKKKTQLYDAIKNLFFLNTFSLFFFRSEDIKIICMRMQKWNVTNL